MGTEIVSTFVESIKGVSTGIADTIVDVFSSICMTPEGGLSNLAIWGLVFGAIGVGLALVRLFTRKIG